jgi:hypothetical protein
LVINETQLREAISIIKKSIEEVENNWGTTKNYFLKIFLDLFNRRSRNSK